MFTEYELEKENCIELESLRIREVLSKAEETMRRIMGKEKSSDSLSILSPPPVDRGKKDDSHCYWCEHIVLPALNTPLTRVTCKLVDICLLVFLHVLSLPFFSSAIFVQCLHVILTIHNLIQKFVTGSHNILVSSMKLIT